MGSALALWKTFIVISRCESPIVVVLTGSMEPAYVRGDLLFLSYYDYPVEVGDVIVYKLDYQEIPIVHRALQI